LIDVKSERLHIYFFHTWKFPSDQFPDFQVITYFCPADVSKASKYSSGYVIVIQEPGSAIELTYEKNIDHTYLYRFDLLQ
jgi:hypothetical protein